jgi:hypothetical protein
MRRQFLVQDACPPLPIGLVFWAMLLARAGTSQVSASLTTVPGVVLYFTALEIAKRASGYREFSKCQFA